MKFNEITTSDVMCIHDIITKKYGIIGVCNNQGLIESLLEKIDFLDYDNLYKRAAVLFEGLIRLHPFADGNKRTALESVKHYLNINEYVLFFPLSTVGFIHKIADDSKNTPKDNDELITEITWWLRLYGIRVDEKFVSKLKLLYLMCYKLPEHIIQFFVNIHMYRFAKWITKKYLYGNINNMNKNMVNYITELIIKQLKDVEGSSIKKDNI